jgi:hypothetical protein
VGVSGWNGSRPRRRRRATFTRPHGVRHLFAVYDLRRDRLYGHVKKRKRRAAPALPRRPALSCEGSSLKAGPGLRWVVIAASRDLTSHSVRRYAALIVARYMPLDRETIEVIETTARDYPHVSLGLTWPSTASIARTSSSCCANFDPIQRRIESLTSIWGKR